MAGSSSSGPSPDPSPPRPGRWSLLAHLLALVGVVAVVVASVGAYMSLRAYQDARRRATAQLRETVDVAARGVRQDLEAAAGQAAAVAPGLAQVFGAAASAGVPLAQVCELAFGPGAVFTTGQQHLLDADGTVACTSDPAALGAPYGAEPWFARLAGGGPAVVPVERDPATGGPGVAVGAAIPGPGGAPAGYYLSVLAVAPVASALAELYGGPAGYDFIVAGDGGHTLSSSAAPGGPERIFSGSAVEMAGWRIRGGVTESAALAPARDEMRRTSVLVATSLAALMMLALAVHRRLLRPVRDLSRVVVRAGAESGARAPVKGPAELARLAVELNATLAARDRAEADLAAAAAALEHNGRILVEAREQERQRLGKQIHDGPIQEMIVAGWALDEAATTMPGGALDRPRQSLDAAVDSARSIEADLRPPKLAAVGLSEAVRELVERRRSDNPLTVDFDDRLAGERFPLHLELLVYRSVQEALRNARKHSHAGLVTVVLEQRDGCLCAAVVDDGVGVDDAALDGRGGSGYGIVSLRNTAELTGARFHIGRRPTGGTEVRLEVPLPAGAQGSR